MENQITPIEMAEAYQKHLPSKFTQWFYRNWGTEATTKTKHFFTAWLILLFLIGFICTAIDKYNGIALIATLVLSGSLFLLGIPWVGVWISQRIRITKVAKELGISIKQWNRFVTLYDLTHDDLI